MTRALGGIETQMTVMHQELGGTTQGAQCVRLRGNIQGHELREAARILFDTYPALRCRIQGEDDGFRFIPQDDVDHIEVRERPELADSTLEAALEEEVADPVDPTEVVWRLAVSGDDRCEDRVVVATCHHAVIDGAGFQVLFRTLFRTLDALRCGIQPPRTQRAFPPLIDDFLLPTATGSARPSKPIDPVPHHARSPIGHRKTRMIPGQLSVEASRRLNKACEAVRISVNALLSAATAAACRDLGVAGSEVPFKTAVSLRDRVAENGVSVDQLGCYISVADAILEPRPLPAGGYDLVSLAKQYDAQLLLAMMKSCVRKPSLTLDDVLRMARSLREGSTFAHGIGIANAGTVELDTQYKTLQVLDWQGINNRVGGNVSIVLHPIMFGGVQKLGVVYPEPLVDGDVARAVSGRVVDYSTR